VAPSTATCGAPSISISSGIGAEPMAADSRSTARASGDSFSSVTCQVVITESG